MVVRYFGQSIAMVKVYTSPFDDIFRKHAGQLANDDEFIKIVGAVTYAESGWNTNNTSGDHGHSWGLFQMADNGLGHGMGNARLNPDAASAVMVPLLAQAYQAGVKLGLSGPELASYVGRNAEHPGGWQDPKGSAAANYINGYRYVSQVTGTVAPYDGSGVINLPTIDLPEIPGFGNPTVFLWNALSDFFGKSVEKFTTDGLVSGAPLIFLIMGGSLVSLALLGWAVQGKNQVLSVASSARELGDFGSFL